MRVPPTGILTTLFFRLWTGLWTAVFVLQGVYCFLKQLLICLFYRLWTGLWVAVANCNLIYCDTTFLFFSFWFTALGLFCGGEFLLPVRENAVGLTGVTPRCTVVRD